jgi:4-hydroxy-3-polyprenylbenzoate decarboxylase
VIRPPEPGFYNQSRRVDDRVEVVVARVLDYLEIEQERMPRWGLAANVA